MKFKNIYLIFFVFFSISMGCVSTDKPAEWIYLFDGETLDGWTKKGGDAPFRAIKGELVGTSIEDTPNSFLTTNINYGDFILELECKVDPPLNSGIQIRSASKPEYKNGRVHGYQVEIDPTKRALSGGIYDEASRGWLYNIDTIPEAKKAFKKDKWNHYRIEAIGDTIKSWVNNVPTSYLVDNKNATGFIGLQVHSLHKGEPPGLNVRWRNIRILTKDVAAHSRYSPLTIIDTRE